MLHVAENEIDAKRHFLKLFLPFWQRYQFRRISKIYNIWRRERIYYLKKKGRKTRIFRRIFKKTRENRIFRENLSLSKKEKVERRKRKREREKKDRKVKRKNGKNGIEEFRERKKKDRKVKRKNIEKTRKGEKKGKIRIFRENLSKTKFEKVPQKKYYKKKYENKISKRRRNKFHEKFHKKKFDEKFGKFPKEGNLSFRRTHRIRIGTNDTFFQRRLLQ